MFSQIDEMSLQILIEKIQMIEFQQEFSKCGYSSTRKSLEKGGSKESGINVGMRKKN